MENSDSLLDRCLQSIDVGTNGNVEDVVWLWIAFQETPENSGDIAGNTGGKPYRTRGKRRLKFELGKGLLDWNSLIAIGDFTSGD